MPTSMIVNSRPIYLDDLAVATTAGETATEDVGGSGTETLTKIDAAQLFNAQLPVYADNATATGAGMTAGQVYRTAAGQLMIVY